MSLKVYLSGKMSGISFSEMNDWRVNATTKLKIAAYDAGVNITVINPVQYYNFEEKRHQTEREVQEFDLHHTITSDIVIVNLKWLYSSIGTIIELHDANYHNKIPIIAFGDKSDYESLHPWVKNTITRVEDNIDDVVAYIKDFYLT